MNPRIHILCGPNLVKLAPFLFAILLPLAASAQSMFPQQGFKTATVKEKRVRRIPSPPGEDLVLLIQGS